MRLIQDMSHSSTLLWFTMAIVTHTLVDAFAPIDSSFRSFDLFEKKVLNEYKRSTKTSSLFMAIDSSMMERLHGIKRSYQALTERLADPDVIADSSLLMKVMSDRSQSEEVCERFDEVSACEEEK